MGYWAEIALIAAMGAALGVTVLAGVLAVQHQRRRDYPAASQYFLISDWAILALIFLAIIGAEI